MGFSEIKKELQKLDKDKIIELVADLYKKNKSIKEFFDYYINPNERELFEKYREKIFEAFYPKRGYNHKLKDGKQAISDFKKLSPSADFLADLMLYYVETGVKFTNEFGDIDESFYSSLESTFVAVLKLMKKENLLDKFDGRAAKVVSDSSEIGWGLYEYLFDAYYDFYDKYYDDTNELTE